MIQISPIFATTIVQKIALYCSSYNGNDVYYLKETVLLMINLFGEDNLIKMMKEDKSANSKVIIKMGEDWFSTNGMKRKLKKMSTILEKVNKSYSILEDKTLKKKEKEEIRLKDYLAQCKRLPEIENDLYALFVFLIQNSSIQQMNISPQFLKVLEKGKSFGGVNKPRINESNKLQQ